jgi:hypothetical protein
VGVTEPDVGEPAAAGLVTDSPAADDPGEVAADADGPTSEAQPARSAAAIATTSERPR